MEEIQKRLERKVDGLVDLTVQIARVEERMLAYMSASDRLGKQFEELRNEIYTLKGQIKDVEAEQKTSVMKIQVGERIFWIVLTVILTSIITAIVGAPGLFG